MFDTMNVALSGLNAASARLNVTANNIANLDSENYTPQRANLSESPNGDGVYVSSLSPLDTPPDDHLPQDLVDLKTSQVLYSANAAVIRTSNHMLGSLLDVLDHDNDTPP